MTAASIRILIFWLHNGESLHVFSEVGGVGLTLVLFDVFTRLFKRALKVSMAWR